MPQLSPTRLTPVNNSQHYLTGVATGCDLQPPVTIVEYLRWDLSAFDPCLQHAL